jgi:hypothetical protein
VEGIKEKFFFDKITVTDGKIAAGKKKAAIEGC